MKTLPRTRLLVVTAIGLLSVAAGLVFAKPHTPTRTPRPTFKCHLVLKQAPGDCAKYNDALRTWKNTPGHNNCDHHIRCDEGPWDGCYSREDGRPNNNVTQHLATQNPQDLIDFLTSIK